jgi:hypothetical protein
MKRRAWLRHFLASLAAVRAWAQTVTFPGRQRGALRALATLVLPSSLGPAHTDRVVDRFIEWVRGYRAGADLEHGYGFPRLHANPPLPVANYIQQLEALGESPTRAAVERAITDAKVAALPQSPTGVHIATDLMSFYFQSSEANDACYQAKIGRDECRSLLGSENPPSPLKG